MMNLHKMDKNKTLIECLFLSLLITTLCTILNADKVLFEYFPSTTKSTEDILMSTLVDSDRENKIKILPKNRDFVLQLYPNQEVSLITAIVRDGPVSLSLSPCSGALQWKLFWRPHSSDDLEIVEQIESNKAMQRHNNKIASKRKEDKDLHNTGTNQHRRRKLKIHKMPPDNFTLALNKDPQLTYLQKGPKRILEALISQGEGSDPWIFQRKDNHPGLYILKVKPSKGHAKIHIMASTTYRSAKQRQREIDSLKAKETRRQSLNLQWSSRSDGEKLYCLAISRHQFHSSLCAAKELQRNHRTHTSSSNHKSFIFGCTYNTQYNLPAASNVKYYVSIWQQSSLIPLVQATIESGTRRQTCRLRPGLMVPFTLTAGGQVTAKFNVKKTGKKLHVAAVSCYGGVKVVVLAGKERVAAAHGKEALHLAVRHAPRARLRIKVSPEPPLQAHYRVHLVVTHSARKLPIPRLPKDVDIKVRPLNCSSFEINWFKSPGGATYCIVLQRHPSGRPPGIRPPIQCGWEKVIKRKDIFSYLECFEGTADKVQSKILTDFEPNGSYLVNILVRHPITGRTLTLSPNMVNLPACTNDNYIPAFTTNNKLRFYV